MGDSGLTTYLAVVAIVVILVAAVLAAVAWRVRKRTVRIAIGVGLVLLGLLCAVLSLVAAVLVAGLGMAVLVVGVRTAPTVGQTEGVPARERP